MSDIRYDFLFTFHVPFHVSRMPYDVRGGPMRPNVILIVVDSLRKDYVGCYGNSDVHTPTIDRLASEGVRFNQHISQASWTAPSLGSILTGLNSFEVDMFKWREDFKTDILPIFPRLQKAGYRIASYVADCTSQNCISSANVLGNARDTDSVFQWLHKNRESPFFLFLHYWGVHVPYEFKDSAAAWWSGVSECTDLVRNGKRDRVIRQYQKAIEALSEEYLPNLLNELQTLNVHENTLLIFTADHGEGWGERLKDDSEFTFHDYHQNYLYDEIIQTPLILNWRGYLPKGKVVQSQTRSIDIVPTILGGLEIPPDTSEDYRPIEGTSLLPLMIRDKDIGPREAFSATTIGRDAETIGFKASPKVSLRLPEWKFIWTFKTQEKELYDLRSDPGEIHNLYAPHSPIACELEQRIVDKLGFNSTPHLETDFELSEKDRFEIETRLRGLGYIE